MGRGSVAKDPVNFPLLAGYFGFGNAGDEMILQLLQDRLGPAPYLSGPRPHHPLDIPRFNLIKILKNLIRSRALVLGGGELYQSRTSFRSLAYYLTLPLLARALGRPVLGFSLALDPELGPWSRALTGFVLRKAMGVWVRDHTSRRFLEQSGLAPQQMPDVVWAWPVPTLTPPPSLRRVLWIPRWASLDEQAISLNYAFHAIPDKIQQGIMTLDPSEDGPPLRRFYTQGNTLLRLETWTTPQDIFDRLASYDLVITMRYHGLVAAVLARRPVVVIPAHGKVRDLARELNVPIIEPRSVSSTEWLPLLEKIFENGAPRAGDRPARAATALNEFARVFANIPLHN
jgi:polysaccharide pyruvyl transferase CsaB